MVDPPALSESANWKRSYRCWKSMLCSQGWIWQLEPFAFPSFGHLLCQEGRIAPFSLCCSRCMNQVVMGWSLFTVAHWGLSKCSEQELCVDSIPRCCALGLLGAAFLLGFPALQSGAPLGRAEENNPTLRGCSSRNNLLFHCWEGWRLLPGGGGGVLGGVLCTGDAHQSPACPSWLFPALPSACCAWADLHGSAG